MGRITETHDGVVIIIMVTVGCVAQWQNAGGELFLSHARPVADG